MAEFSNGSKALQFRRMKLRLNSVLSSSKVHVLYNVLCILLRIGVVEDLNLTLNFGERIKFL